MKKIRIQDRDVEIFNWLYKFRFLTAHQIAGLVEAVEEKTVRPNYQFKNGHDSVIKRINLLTKSSHLHCLKKAFQKYIYTLGSKAIDVLTLEKGLLREDIYHTLDQKRRGEKHLEHSLMIAEFGATLALAVKMRPGIELICWLPESDNRQFETEIPEENLTSEMKKWKKKDEIYGLKLSKKPDAIFGLKDQKGKMFFMFEAERTTKASKIILKNMVSYYYFLAQDQFSDWGLKMNIFPDGKPNKKFRVITYTVTPQWQETLIKISLNVNPEKSGSRLFWFANQSKINPDNPETMLYPIFSIAHEEELNQEHSILE